MQLLSFRSSVGRVIADHGSRFTLVPLMRPTDVGRTVAIHLGAGDVVGAHDAAGHQLLLVVRGAGWVSGDDGVRHDIGEDQAALFEPGERHAAGTTDGMVAIVVEGEFETA